MSPSTITIIVSLLFSAFFSGIEIAYVSYNRLELELKKKKGQVSARIVGALMKQPTRFIGALLIGNNIALVIYGIAMADVLQPYVSNLTQSPIIVILAQTLISTAIVLFTAEFLPKSLFRIKPASLLITFSIPLWITYVILYIPARLIIGLSEFLLSKILKIDFSYEDPVFGKTDLDHYLRLVTAPGTKKEDIEPEIQIFQNALDFSKVKLRECMVPRTEIVALDVTDDIEMLRKQFIKTGLSKILIYKDTIDNIIGYAHSYELFKMPQTIKSILLPILIVPESMPASELMERNIKEHKSVAVVVDEFGGTAGIVTMEDIMEEIFGEIEDEHDVEELIEKQISKNEFLFSARLEIDMINSKYGIYLPKSEEYETLGGLVVHQHESIPSKDEKIIIDGILFTIVEASDTKIETIRVKVISDS